MFGLRIFLCVQDEKHCFVLVLFIFFPCLLTIYILHKLCIFVLFLREVKALVSISLAFIGSLSLFDNRDFSVTIAMNFDIVCS